MGARSFLLALPLLGFALACSDAAPLYEGMPEHVKERHIPMEGAANFRDLGGYQTADDRTVKWATFYRSDNLHGLSDADLEKMEGLGIQLVCDFRGPDEWKEEPDRLPENNPPEVVHLEIWDPSFSSDGIRDLISDPDELAKIDLADFLVEGNRMFATKFADRYKAMFDRITQADNLPALVHCTAGKDRAGFASAVILHTLGVPLETVYDDFLLTNHYAGHKIERAIQMAELFSLFRIEGESLRPVLGVERRFLEAAFAAIEENYGNFDAYRRDVLGISDPQLAAFKQLALE